MSGRIGYYGGIVKDGLVLDLDAGKKDSYNRVGTAWNDISGNAYNGTLRIYEWNFYYRVLDLCTKYLDCWFSISKYNK